MPPSTEIAVTRTEPTAARTIAASWSVYHLIWTDSETCRQAWLISLTPSCWHRRRCLRDAAAGETAGASLPVVTDPSGEFISRPGVILSRMSGGVVSSFGAGCTAPCRLLVS
jgi:hypothetical protein